METEYLWSRCVRCELQYCCLKQLISNEKKRLQKIYWTDHDILSQLCGVGLGVLKQTE